MTLSLATFAVLFALALGISYLLGRYASSDGVALFGGPLLGFFVLFGKSCLDMSTSNPVQSNGAAEVFFWGFILVPLWLLIGGLASAMGREHRQRNSEEEHDR